MTEPTKPGLTVLGKLISFLLIVLLLGIGGYVVYTKMLAPKMAPQNASSGGTVKIPSGQAQPAQGNANIDTSDVVEAKTSVGALAPAAMFLPKDDTIVIELSEYAGYAGLIVANGGLDPNPNSMFAKYGVKVKLTLSEDESWSKLNAGQIAGSATTADVLAIYGRQLQAVVPAQIGFSRGADALVVRQDVKRINQLKGKLIAAAQFNESDFMIRYLAQEAGMDVNMVNDIRAGRDPDKLNVVYCKDAFAAGDLFLKDIKAGGNSIAGCMTWDPKTTEVVQDSGGQANVLVTNKNLLVVADVLILNKPWAQKNPDKVRGIVAGMLEGNRAVRSNPDNYLSVIGKVFKWDNTETRRQLAKVHLSNLPENTAFFGGTMDAAGSFSGIYQMAVLAYGPRLIPNPIDAENFLAIDALRALEKEGFGKGDVVAIAPIRSGQGGTLENDPLLSKDIRFFFEPNSYKLDMSNKDNDRNLAALKQMLQVSPGSSILLRGHVDNARVAEFRKQGGDAFVREMALKAMELSKNRANEVRRALQERYQIPTERLNTVGRGWEEPAGADSEKNRRVEAQWFTIE